MMRPEQERVQNLLKDTVTTLCRNSLQYLRGMKVQGLLGITLDDEDVFVVHINEMFHNLGADGVLIQQADSVSQGEDINYNQCAPSSVTEDSPQRISAQPAVRTLSSTSPLGRNSSRRKARPSRAIGGLSSPSATLSTSDIYTEADCAQIAIKQESESIVVEDDLVDMSDSYNVLSSAEGDDEADVGLMKQSYMEESHKDRSMEEPNNNQTTATDLQATTPSGVTSSSANSITGQMRSEVDNSSFPQLVTFNPQFNAGGPFIAGVAPGFTDTSNASFQLQEVDGNTLIMGVPASTLGQVVDNYQEDWPTNNEELGLTSRGQPRKRRMWYRPRGAMSAPGPLGQMEESDTSLDTSSLGDVSQNPSPDQDGEAPSQGDSDSPVTPIVIAPTTMRSANNRRRNIPPPTHKEFKCNTCSKSYWSRNTLMRHQKSHDPKLVSCKKCTLYFESEEALQNHEATKHVNAICGRYKCRFCEKVFRRKHQYLIHLRMIHNTISNG